MKMTPDEENDAIRQQVDDELPRPPGGFESEDREDDHQRAHEARFLALMHDPSLWTFSTEAGR